MGVSRSGRFVALTNVRDPSRQRSDARSRGLLVGEILADPRPLGDALTSRTSSDYNGFTLIAADWSAEAAGMPMLMTGTQIDPVEVVAPGVHGLSNARLDTPWPKVVALRTTMRAAVETRQDEDTLIATLDGALADRRVASDAELPSTGVSLEWERALSAPFIALPNYGTRSTTIVLIDVAGHVTFVERDASSARDPVTERFAIA
jgi:uncharacterized protein with NRDE domain